MVSPVTWAFGPLFPAFIVIYAASLLGLIWIGATLAEEGIRDRFDDRFPRRPWASLSVGMSILLAVLWLVRIARGNSGDVVGLLNGETTMTIQALDLGLVVPISVLVAVLAWRRQPAGTAAAAAFLVTFVMMTAAIASMLVSAWAITGMLELPPIVMFVVATMAGVAIGVRMFQSAGSRSSPAGPQLHGVFIAADLPAAGEAIAGARLAGRLTD